MQTTSFAALALTAALGLSACGGGDPDAAGPSSSSSSTSSASATSSGTGLKTGDTVDGSDLATRMTDAMVKAGSAGFVMELGTQGRATGWFTYKGGEMQQQVRMNLQGQAMQVVMLDGIFYMQGIPGSTKPWVRIDPKGDDPLSKLVAEATGDLGDPRQFAKALDGTKAQVVSSSADATVYSVEIDASKVLGDAAQSAGNVTARYTLDSKDRPTKMVVEVQGETVTLTLQDWGQDVDVVAPPADQVGTFELPTG